MILLPRAVRVYFATAPTDMRKSFDGLSNVVRSLLQRDPLSGHVFVFLNRRKRQVKLLVWDARWIHRRAQAARGRNLRLPGARDADLRVRAPIDAHELSMLLEGIDATEARASRRWEPPAHARAAGA